MILANGERRVGRSVENKSDIRLGTLGRLDQMAWSKFRWLPDSEKTMLIGNAKKEKGLLLALGNKENEVKSALKKNGIGVEACIVKSDLNVLWNPITATTACPYGLLGQSPYRRFYKQISVTLGIPGLNNDKPVTVEKKKQKYMDVELEPGIGVDLRSVLGKATNGETIITWTEYVRHYHLTDKRTFYPKTDIKDAKLVSIAINGKTLYGSLPNERFSQKLFSYWNLLKSQFMGKRPVVEIGLCVIYEDLKKNISLSYEKIRTFVSQK